MSTYRSITRFIADDDGQDLIEYALLAGFISLVAILAITALGGGVKAIFDSLTGKVDSIPK